VARMALLLAGLPVEVPGQTVNRCAARPPGSGQCSPAIKAGEGDVFIARRRNMTRAPYVTLKSGEAWSRRTRRSLTRRWDGGHESPLKAGMDDFAGRDGRGSRATLQITRAEQDGFAVESQRRAQAALKRASSP